MPSPQARIHISAEVPDWSYERPSRFWDPGKKLLLAIRHYQQLRKTSGLLATPLTKLAILRHRFWSVVAAADIPLNCNIGGGLSIPHPNGIVIHPDARIGVNCLILSQVTIGSRDDYGVPEIAGHVEIGSGARILGRVHVGAHARIGANAVVISDVPPGATVVGIPATVVKTC